MESYHDQRNRRKLWIKRVKIGDIVCDCRYFHSKVIALEHHYGGKWEKGFPWRYKAVILENGNHCSLYHCASDPNHKCPHPTKSQMREFMGDFWTEHHEKLYADWPE